MLPTLLQKGKVANVEEVKGSGHIDYSVALLGTLTKATNMEDITQTGGYRAVGELKEFLGGRQKLGESRPRRSGRCSCAHLRGGRAVNLSFILVQLGDSKLFQMGHEASP